MIASPRVTTVKANLAESFRNALPALEIVEESAERTLASSDIAGPGNITVSAVLRPDTLHELEAIVRVARAEGCALTQRGGGLSYSGGCVPSHNPAVAVDTRRLQSIQIDRGAGRVSAGAGVTWGMLYDVLGAENLRVPSFGPLSGVAATVGGLVAQNGGFFGTASYGPVADRSLVSSTMITGVGEWITPTQDDRIDGSTAPQPFAGDCGAFGIRGEVTLALMPRPSVNAFASFAFAEGDGAIATLVALRGLAGLGEAFVFDPATHDNLARTGFSISESASIAGDLLAAAAGGLGGVADVLRAVRWRQTSMADIGWSLHVSAEGDAATAKEALAEAARRALACGGKPIPDVIPRVTRVRPFRRIKALLGPDGEMWLPVHGVFEVDAAQVGLTAARQRLSECAIDMQRHNVRATVMAVLMGDRVVIEPQLFWPDALSPLHRRLCQPEQVTAYGDRPANLAVREFAHALRRALIRALDDAGAAHFQVGRTYADHPGISARAREAWIACKQRFDPDRIMNPGVLGL
jgi:FAD/FMN-containing dehydrogenase